MSEAETRLRRLLALLEKRIDLDHVRQVRSRNRAAIRFEPVERLPLVCHLPYQGDEFHLYPRSEAIEDPAKMIVNELLAGFGSPYLHIMFDIRDDAHYAVRPSLGVGIMASTFGSEIRIFNEDMPWALPLDSLDEIRAIVDNPLPDPRAGLAGRILDAYDYFHAILVDYPTCREAFEITLPDLQGPWSTVELLWGSRIYLDLFDHEELVRRLLHHVTEHTINMYHAFAEKCNDSLMPEDCHQLGVAARGRYVIRNDSIINISPKMYRDLIRPYDKHMSMALGGVGFHVCGTFRHQVRNLLDVPGVTCIDFGQPELNDIDAIYQKAAPKRVALVNAQLPLNELRVDRVRRRYPTGMNLRYNPPDPEAARRLFAHYLLG